MVNSDQVCIGWQANKLRTNISSTDWYSVMVSSDQVCTGWKANKFRTVSSTDWYWWSILTKCVLDGKQTNLEQTFLRQILMVSSDQVCTGWKANKFRTVSSTDWYWWTILTKCVLDGKQTNLEQTFLRQTDTDGHFWPSVYWMESKQI